MPYRVQPPPGDTVRRVVAILGGVALVAVAAAVVVATVDRRALLQDGIEWALRRQGVPDPHVAVREVGFRTLRLGPIRLGRDGAVTAKGATIGYVPLDLVRGRVRSVAIDGLRAQAEVTAGGVRLVGLSLPQGGGSGGALPIDALALRDARIELQAPTGEAELVADGTYAMRGTDFALALEAPNGEARIRAMLSTSGPPDAPHVDLDATADIPAESVLWNIASLPPPSTGDVRLALSAKGTAPHALPQLAAAPSLAGMAFDVTARLDAPGLDALAAGRGLQGLHLDATGHVAGTETGVSGTAALGVRIHKLRRAEAAADDVAIDAPILFDLAKGEVTVALTAPGRIAAKSLSSGGLAFAGPVDWRVTAAKAPLVRLVNGAASFAVTLASAKDALTLAGEGTPMRLALAGTRLTITGDGAAGTVSFDTTARLTNPAGWIAPLRVGGTARLAAGKVTLGADARDPKGRRVAHLAGTAASDGDPVDLTLTAGPFAFAPGALQPAALSPLLAGFTGARGGAAATLRVRRQRGRIATGGEVTLDRLSFGLGGMQVTGLDGTISLRSLAPLATPPDQSLTADRVAMVTALDKLRARFALVPGPRLDLAAATADFAGGTLALGPASFGAGAAPRLTVAVRDVKITPLLKLLDVGGLSGTGVLNGAIPVAFSAGRVTIDRGRLASEGKGVIQVRSEQAAKALAGGGQSAQLVVQALRDFHYDSLAIEIDKSATGDAHAVIHLKGANPAVMNAQPFVFNIDVASNVDKLIDALMHGYRLATGMVGRAAKGATHAR